MHCFDDTKMTCDLRSNAAPAGASGRRWAIVLAAGDGRRVGSLTRDRLGRPTPKQFCSVTGGATLIQETLDRGARIVGRRRVVTVVAAQHTHWWRQDTSGWPARNVVVQPRNRGTAAGILLPLMAILRRDPRARFVVLPSDHFVRDEAVLDESVRVALASVDDDPSSLVLLGITPERTDPELGWIVPGAGNGGAVRPVARFVEKPPLATAKRLLRNGALWNSFIFAGKAAALVELYRRTLPDLLDAFTGAIDGGQEILESMYRRLEPRDFSRELLEPNASALRVLATGPCGWSDLGTPERLARCALAFVTPGRLDRRGDLAFGSRSSRPVLAAVV